jgi:hypothetical protein
MNVDHQEKICIWSSPDAAQRNPGPSIDESNEELLTNILGKYKITNAISLAKRHQ